MKGQLIVIEGASDGIGKSTQLELLQKHLEADGISIVTHHFPTYSSYQGKSVEEYLSGHYGTPAELSPYFINSLYAHDRAITWHTKLKSAYADGHTILLDRYTTSSLIYQSALITEQTEKRRFIDYVIDFEYHKLGIRQPDQVIFLQAPLDLINQLRRARTENAGNIVDDVYERDQELLRRIYENAIFVANYLHWTCIDCATADGKNIRTPAEIHQDIYNKTA